MYRIEVKYKEDRYIVYLHNERARVLMDRSHDSFPEYKKEDKKLPHCFHLRQGGTAMMDSAGAFLPLMNQTIKKRFVNKSNAIKYAETLKKNLSLFIKEAMKEGALEKELSNV